MDAARSWARGGERLMRPPTWAIHALLALAVLFVYEPVRNFPFVVYDDKAFVTENPAVLHGLAWDGVVHAFTTATQGNYVPLAWLSHMLDVELFGLDAGAHHLVNVLLHLLATLLLFEVSRRATRDIWPSAFVAAVFGVHPIHVESVAWVAERRDALSGLFFVATLGAYTSWARAPSGRAPRYIALLLLYTMGLLSKPMLVTVPFVLLLLDLWPLRRTNVGLGRLLGEKLPLLVPALAVSVLAVTTQGAVLATLGELPLGARISNALLAYTTYLGQLLVPVSLAVFYPLEFEPRPLETLAAAGLLAAITAFALATWRERPYLVVGWLWFVGMLVPVIGLVQVGSQAMADRYTYLPSIGLSLAAAWGGAAVLRGGAPLPAKQILGGAAATWLCVCLLLGRAQVFTWQDSVTLFRHARLVTGENVVAELNLAEAYADAGDDDLALAHYERALAWVPGVRGAHASMGRLLSERGDTGAAADHLRLAVHLHPEDPKGHRELGRLALRTGQVPVGRAALDRALALDPADAQARYHRAEAAALGEGHSRAVGQFEEALASLPPPRDEPLLAEEPAVLAALSEAWDAAGDRERAIFWARRALALARASGQTGLVIRIQQRLDRLTAKDASG